MVGLEPPPVACLWFALASFETTNQRTDEPMLAALTAETSPTPPGGETTTTELISDAAAASNLDDSRAEYRRYGGAEDAKGFP